MSRYLPPALRTGQESGDFVPFEPGRKVGHRVDRLTGCWIWIGAVMWQGYGVLGRGRAHRVYYERVKGPVPEGLELDHLCRNRACVNPDHLEAVTRRENLRRGLGTRLTAQGALDIIARLDRGETVWSVARAYTTQPSNIRSIRDGRSWADVTGRARIEMAPLKRVGPTKECPICHRHIDRKTGYYAKKTGKTDAYCIDCSKQKAREYWRNVRRAKAHT